MAGAAQLTPSPTPHHEPRFHRRSARRASRSRRAPRDEVATARTNLKPPKVVMPSAGGRAFGGQYDRSNVPLYLTENDVNDLLDAESVNAAVGESELRLARGSGEALPS